MAGDRDTSSLTVASTCERLAYFCVLHLHTQVLWPYESVLLTSQVRPLDMGAGRWVALWVENEQQRSDDEVRDGLPDFEPRARVGDAEEEC